MMVKLLAIEWEELMMKHYSLTYFIKQSLSGIFRNGVMSSACIIILVLSMLIIGSFWTINENINFNLSSIDDLNIIVVYLKDGADPDVVHEKLEKIPGNPEITFIPKDIALQNEKDRYEANDKGHLLEFFNEENNPLPDTFEIKFQDIDKTSTISYHLNKIEEIDDVRDMLEVSKNVSQLKKGVTVICSWLLIVLSVVSFIIIIITLIN